MPNDINNPRRESDEFRRILEVYQVPHTVDTDHSSVSDVVSLVRFHIPDLEQEWFFTKRDGNLYHVNPNDLREQPEISK